MFESHRTAGRDRRAQSADDARLHPECSSLAELPDAIGELKALTTLDLSYCSSLAALPAAIGELGALTELGVTGCYFTKLPVAIILDRPA